jgi:hypothetical protein
MKHERAHVTLKYEAGDWVWNIQGQGWEFTCRVVDLHDDLVFYRLNQHLPFCTSIEQASSLFDMTLDGHAPNELEHVELIESECEVLL